MFLVHFVWPSGSEPDNIRLAFWIGKNAYSWNLNLEFLNVISVALRQQVYISFTLSCTWRHIYFPHNNIYAKCVFSCNACFIVLLLLAIMYFILKLMVSHKTRTVMDYYVTAQHFIVCYKRLPWTFYNYTTYTANMVTGWLETARWAGLNKPTVPSAGNTALVVPVNYDTWNLLFCQHSYESVFNSCDLTCFDPIIRTQSSQKH